ncbi:hypothetical protein ISCGN_027933 [Ixodes scapularis]
MRLGILGTFVTSLVPDGKGYGVNVVVTSVATWWRVDDLRRFTTDGKGMCKGCTHAAPRQVGNHGTTDKPALRPNSQSELTTKKRAMIASSSAVPAEQENQGTLTRALPVSAAGGRASSWRREYDSAR